jgi:hypothetical protein
MVKKRQILILRGFKARTSALITTAFIPLCVAKFLDSKDLINFANIVQKYNKRIRVIPPNTSIRMPYACTNKDLENISNLIDIEELILPSMEHITERGLLAISKISELRTLKMYGETIDVKKGVIFANRFGGLQHLAKLTKLTTLEMKRCCLVNTYFSPMYSLTSLCIDFCRISRQLHKSLINLPNLHKLDFLELHLNFTFFPNYSSFFTNSTQCTHLNVEGTNLSTSEIAALSQLPLTTLNLKDNANYFTI